MNSLHLNFIIVF